jgi:hypothetical protein
MPANTSPVFPLDAVTTWGTVTTANTAKDGTGTVVTVATGGTNGTRLDQIMVRPLGTNIAAVLRFFVNNGLTNATPANNSLAHEVTCAATTLSEVAALAGIDVTVTKGSDVLVPIPYLPPGYKLNVTIGTTVAAGFAVTVHGGSY